MVVVIQFFYSDELSDSNMFLFAVKKRLEHIVISDPDYCYTSVL